MTMSIEEFKEIYKTSTQQTDASEEQAEEKEIAAAFLQKRKIRAAAAGITFHEVW